MAGEVDMDQIHEALAEFELEASTREELVELLTEDCQYSPAQVDAIAEMLRALRTEI